MLHTARPLPLRAMLLACALSFGFTALPYTANVAFAQDKAAKGEKAEKGPSVGLKIAKPLKAAQEAMAAKNWKEAKTKIEEHGYECRIVRLEGHTIHPDYKPDYDPLRCNLHVQAGKVVKSTLG